MIISRLVEFRVSSCNIYIILYIILIWVAFRHTVQVRSSN